MAFKWLSFCCLIVFLRTVHFSFIVSMWVGAQKYRRTWNERKFTFGAGSCLSHWRPREFPLLLVGKNIEQKLIIKNLPGLSCQSTFLPKMWCILPPRAHSVGQENVVCTDHRRNSAPRRALCQSPTLQPMPPMQRMQRTRRPWGGWGSAFQTETAGFGVLQQVSIIPLDPSLLFCLD